MQQQSRTVRAVSQALKQDLEQRHLPLVDLLIDTRAELMELVVTSGLKVLDAMLEEDRTVLCAPGMCTGRIAPPGGLGRHRVKWCSAGGKSRSAGRGSAARPRRCRSRRFRRWPTPIRSTAGSSSSC